MYIIWVKFINNIGVKIYSLYKFENNINILSIISDDN